MPTSWRGYSLQPSLFKFGSFASFYWVQFQTCLCHTIANALIHLCCVVPACSNYWTLLPDPKVAPDPIRLTKHNISHNYLGPLDCCS
ncbi:hypothetical protein OPQ81_009834 [Rhizoctonia solani]|nr:hypothetical protein OPQ81_009834 [Rhizoctonia solani]